MFDLTQIIQAIIALVAAMVTTFLIPFIRSRLSAEQQAELVKWVKIAVTAAEQMKEFSESGMGEMKKKYVLGFLEERGFKIDEAALGVMIEAAVWEMKRYE